jgi:hypothetical protein
MPDDSRLGMARRTIHERFIWLLNNTLNRVTSAIARSRHGPFSLIRHVGRKSGRSFETPLILAKVPEGFIAELTYGDASSGQTTVHRQLRSRRSPREGE